MVEPFASVVYNSLLLGRPKVNSVVRTVVNTSTHNGVGCDFFSPSPRRDKGKKKLENVPLENPVKHQSLREWSGSSNLHLLLWPFHTHAVMMDELSQGGEGTRTRRREKRPLKPRPRIARSSLMHHNDTLQRRHASFATKTTPVTTVALPPISEFSKDDRKIQHFQRIAQLPQSEIDLDEAWKAYKKVVFYRLPLSTTLSFLDKFISAIEFRYQSKQSEESDQELTTSGKKAFKALTRLGVWVTPTSRFGQQRLCLLARALALRGEFEKATNTVLQASEIELPFLSKTGVVSAYDMILTSLVRYEGNVRAMEYIGDHWETLSKYIRYKLYGISNESFKHAVVSLKTTATRIAAEIERPLSFLEKEGWDKERREDIGCFFIEALSDTDFSTEGSEVFARMKQLDLDVPRRFQFMLIRSLAKRTRTMRHAVDMYKSTQHTENDLPYERLGVYLYARQGNTEELEACFNKIEAMSTPAQIDITSLIHGYAMANDAKRAEETFEKFFPYGEDGKRMNSPTVSNYAAVINAHARKPENAQKEISFWLADLAKADKVPNEYIFTIVINAFAGAGDVDSTMNVLEEMRKAGIMPNAVTYTIVITLLAHRKDSRGAEAVFKRALKEGVVPDNRMIVALMNAHVEGGSWKGVIRAYDYLMAARVTTLSLEVFNTLMKAYVLIGAPFSVVNEFFKRIQASKAKPDAYTYALLVQSACDAGFMDIAADIYFDLKESIKLEWKVDVNVFILTILMAGFLQHGDKVRARGVYQEITKLGINPSPITFRTMLQAYGHEMSRESMEIAEQFVRSLVNVPENQRTWKKPKYDSLSALQHIYGPVLSGWSRMKSSDDVERVLQDLQNSGEDPSLGNLANLLDVYRRTFNIEAAQRVWPSIRTLGLKLTSSDWMTSEDGQSGKTRGIKGNVLCIPLSIYIDALSAAGQHSEIATVWKDLRSLGFSFDSHNWNHLSVAMVRAGQVERAFEVVERVIIPYQELSGTFIEERDSNPSSPLLSDVVKEDQEDQEDEDEVPAVSALRGFKRQAKAKLSASQTEGMHAFGEDDKHSHDSAYHLHILHQISPSWAVWRAHNATLSVLLMAFRSLNEGRLVRPIGDTITDGDEDEPYNAREMLQKISKNYPKTLQLVLEHDEREKQRLTSDEYNEIYNLT